MKIDIACPVELMHFEQADYGNERRQAYLTFLNESPYRITALSGRLMLLDARGHALEDRRVSFGSMGAGAGEEFTCHLALDGFPAFATATILVEDVVFADADPWALHPLRMKDYDPPRRVEGQQRIMLTAVAGPDAICFPTVHDNTWLCVCGRYNRWRWPVCRRCRRERDSVIRDYAQVHVEEQYAQQVRQARQSPPEVIVDGSPRRRLPPPRPAQSAPPRGRPQPARSAPRPMRKWITAAVCVLAVALVVWGITSLARRLPTEKPDTSQTFVTLAPDYLEPL